MTSQEPDSANPVMFDDGCMCSVTALGSWTQSLGYFRSVRA